MHNRHGSAIERKKLDSSAKYDLAYYAFILLSRNGKTSCVESKRNVSEYLIPIAE